jgi:hypothetical protein
VGSRSGSEVSEKLAGQESRQGVRVTKVSHVLLLYGMAAFCLFLAIAMHAAFYRYVVPYWQQDAGEP